MQQHHDHNSTTQAKHTQRSGSPRPDPHPPPPFRGEVLWKILRTSLGDFTLLPETGIPKRAGGSHGWQRSCPEESEQAGTQEH